MGVEAIVSAIAAEADARVAEIRAQTQARVERILGEAAAAADADRARLESERDEEAEQATARIVNRALLEADRQIADVREHLFQDALARLRDRLVDITDGSRYQVTLGALYAEAVAIVGDDDATVLVREADRVLMKELTGDRVDSGHVEGSLVCLGGVDIEAADGRAVRNTFDSRVARSERELRHLAVRLIPDLAKRGAEL